MEGTFWAEKPKWEGLDMRLWVILEHDRSKVWDEDEEEGGKQIIERFLFVSLDITLNTLEEVLAVHKGVNNQVFALESLS